jgi:hypothetical protein
MAHWRSGGDGYDGRRNRRPGDRPTAGEIAVIFAAGFGIVLALILVASAGGGG